MWKLALPSIPVVWSARPRSSGDRALASEAMCAGSNPAGGTFFVAITRWLMQGGANWRDHATDCRLSRSLVFNQPLDDSPEVCIAIRQSPDSRDRCALMTTKVLVGFQTSEPDKYLVNLHTRTQCWAQRPTTTYPATHAARANLRHGQFSQLTMTMRTVSVICAPPVAEPAITTMGSPGLARPDFFNCTTAKSQSSSMSFEGEM